MPYPKWKYSATLPPVIVNDPTAEAALIGTWYDTPPNQTEPDLPTDGGQEYNPTGIS